MSKEARIDFNEKKMVKEMEKERLGKQIQKTNAFKKEGWENVDKNLKKKHLRMLFLSSDKKSSNNTQPSKKQQSKSLTCC